MTDAEKLTEALRLLRAAVYCGWSWSIEKRAWELLNR